MRLNSFHNPLLYEELDSILLAFEEARVSVITMHAPTWTMKTLHLHTIEEEFLRTGHPTDVYTPLVAVDTENRCSVILGYDQYVAVMPHVGSDHSPFTFELKEVDLRIENIIDVCFLHDFDQPTMLILFEPPLWAGLRSVKIPLASLEYL
ncbi:hypothetical protein L596_004395 [Steinernema carpocapsae]|uniref:Uncharacterized protein n=1 Tax=Steinernema carpocapsae TaxID=34508 RepID=A0A4U8UVP1_STECR|nr:hypothetical protein L596_004395 [Steinernema carpocapsae]